MGAQPVRRPREPRGGAAAAGDQRDGLQAGARRRDDRRGVHLLAGRDPGDAPRRPRLRAEVEHGLDARLAGLHGQRAGPPPVPPPPGDVLADVRLERELRPADQPRRGRPRQGLAAAQDARRPLAAAGQPARLLRLHVVPPRQAAASSWAPSSARRPSGPTAAAWTGGCSTSRRTTACTRWSRTSTAPTPRARRCGRWTTSPRGFEWIDANDAAGNTFSFLRFGEPDDDGAVPVVASITNFSGLAAPPVPRRPAAPRPLERDPQHRRRELRRLRRGQPRLRDGRGGPVARPALLGAGDPAAAGRGLAGAGRAGRPRPFTRRRAGRARHRVRGAGGRGGQLARHLRADRQRTMGGGTPDRPSRSTATGTADGASGSASAASEEHRRLVRLRGRARPRPAAARRTRRVRSATPLEASCQRPAPRRTRPAGPDAASTRTAKGRTSEKE